MQHGLGDGDGDGDGDLHGYGNVNGYVNVNVNGYGCCPLSGPAFLHLRLAAGAVTRLGMT